jgi:hypothetical protein
MRMSTNIPTTRGWRGRRPGREGESPPPPSTMVDDAGGGTAATMRRRRRRTVSDRGV